MNVLTKFITTLLFIHVSAVNLQTKSNFTIYVRKNAYNIEDYFNHNSAFQYYTLLGENYIDPNKVDEINEAGVFKGLNNLFPDKNATGVLVLDVENKLFKNLKIYPLNSPEYNNSFQAFKNLISFIRSSRPNLKIGIYGLPFRFYYTSDSYSNSNHKLDSILSLCDIITPSLYTLFPVKQIGLEKNNAYMQQNLQVALDYGKRLNKPVTPFIWYVTSPGNKLYGGEILSKQEMTDQINFIKNFSYNSYKAAGVMWWESSDNAFQKIVKLSEEEKQNSDVIKDKNFIVREYTKSFVQ